MRLEIVTSIAAMLFVLPLIGPGMQAQDNSSRDHKSKHQQYKLVDLGTFGGPASYFANGFDGILNNGGTAVGWSDTSTPDPYPSSCFDVDCYVAHAFRWRHGVPADLGSLAAGWSSQATWVNGNGQIAGFSQNGLIDPLFHYPEIRAVLWGNSGITDLGTLEGGHESLATAVNNSSQVVGFALNTVPDPFCMFAPGFCTTQTRAFLWQNGLMLDLGTLGGSDAAALLVNDRGQIAGQSYTNSIPGPVTGIPMLDPFLWEAGKMVDLGTLGGSSGFPIALNERGQVVGQSNLAGDLSFHPFLWTMTRGMQDLGTFGGATGTTNWINDAGDVAGKADLPGPLPQLHDAALWKDGGMIDLGTLQGDSCSNAYYVNSRGQVVGTSEDQQLCSVFVGEHAFLWENGGPMVDLNTLIPPGASLQLTYAVAINDRGEIAGFGVPHGCSPQSYEVCGHAYVLIPNGECDDNCEARIAASQKAALPSPNPAITIQGNETPVSPLERLRRRVGQHSRIPGQTVLPRY